MTAAEIRVDNIPVVETEVLVVGAGPTGLMAGLVLSRCGLPAVLIDRKAGPTRESKALAVQSRTMEIYDQLGLADEVLAGAFPAMKMKIGSSVTAGGPDLARMSEGESRYRRYADLRTELERETAR